MAQMTSDHRDWGLGAGGRRGYPGMRPEPFHAAVTRRVARLHHRNAGLRRGHLARDGGRAADRGSRHPPPSSWRS